MSTIIFAAAGFGGEQGSSVGCCRSRAISAVRADCRYGDLQPLAIDWVGRIKGGAMARSEKPAAQTLHQMEAAKLRQLMAWYRDFAERAGNSVIWEARLLTAERLEADANRCEAGLGNTEPGRGSGRAAF